MHKSSCGHMLSCLLSIYPSMEMPRYVAGVTFFKKLKNSSGTWLEHFTLPSAMHENSVSCFVICSGYMLYVGLIQIKLFSILLWHFFDLGVLSIEQFTKAFLLMITYLTLLWSKKTHCLISIPFNFLKLILCFIAQTIIYSTIKTICWLFYECQYTV